jgi:hypothetical protein
MSRSYTSSPPSFFMACSGTALALDNVKNNYYWSILTPFFSHAKEAKSVPLYAMEALGGEEV